MAPGLHLPRLSLMLRRPKGPSRSMKPLHALRDAASSKSAVADFADSADLGNTRDQGAPQGEGVVVLNLLHLRELEIDRRGAAEDRHGDLHPRAALVDLLDDPVERGERTVRDAYRL